MVIKGDVSHTLGYTPAGRWFAIALIHPKYTENFGAIMRLAVNFRANAVFLVKARYRRLRTDTLHAAHHLPVLELDSLPSVPGAKYVYVEFSENAIPLPKFKHPKRAIYIFGPEDGSLVVPENQLSVFVPTVASMNLSHAVAVLLYDRMLKYDGENY